MVTVRPAHPGEAAELTALALRSKGFWGYDAAFLESCREELTFTAARVAGTRVFVAESEGVLLGFATLDGVAPDGELGNLWVDPPAIGTGVGGRLWRHVTETARAKGFTSLRIEADPHAEEFYLAMGAVRIGEIPSGSIPGRTLPLLSWVAGALPGAHHG
jgi:GNAT superfamily N-acetyltransferase